jgi:hypothetical protein
MDNEGLPTFISAIIAAVVLGVLVIAGVILHAFLTM